MMRRTCVHLSGRLGAEFSVAEQRRWNLLHSHQRSRTVNDCRFGRICHQVALGRPSTAGTHAGHALIERSNRVRNSSALL